MNKTVLDQYEEIVADALKNCSVKLRKSFKTAFIQLMILYMVLPRKINFTQMGRYSDSSEQLQRCEILDIEGGRAYSVRAYSKAMKRNIKVVVHYPESGGHKIYFSTDLDMSAKDIIEYYRTRFQIEFCFRDSKQFTGLCDCQARDLRKLDFAFNASLASANIAKVMRRDTIRRFPSDC